MKTLSLFICLLMLSGCASRGLTIRDVPTIQAANIKVPTFRGLPQKSLSIEVVDMRSDDLKGNSAVVVAEVDRALVSALNSNQVPVSPTGANALVLSIHNGPVGAYEQGCVKLEASLNVPKRANLKAQSSACFESKLPFGKKVVGTDISKAYEEALTLILLNLDQALQKMSYL
ncbi:hypothetical protein D3C87_339490 [compost metagenome]